MFKINFYIKYLTIVLKKYIHSIIIKNKKNNEILLVVNKNYLFNIFLFYKNNSYFLAKSLNDICVVDYPSKTNRFEVIYNLLSVKNNFRFLIKSFVNQNDSIMSLTTIYNSANWLERECWDLYGVFFSNHPDLRRILTDYGFEGYPLRKDFPLTGYIELRYDDEKANIVYEPLEMSQEYRLFNFTSPWEKLK